MRLCTTNFSSSIEIDYRNLPRNLKDISEADQKADQVKKAGDKLNKELQQKLDTLETIQTPFGHRENSNAHRKCQEEGEES